MWLSTSTSNCLICDNFAEHCIFVQESLVKWPTPRVLAQLEYVVYAIEMNSSSKLLVIEMFLAV
jgi:hypothetical protein